MIPSIVETFSTVVYSLVAILSIEGRERGGGSVCQRSNRSPTVRDVCIRHGQIHLYDLLPRVNCRSCEYQRRGHHYIMVNYSARIPSNCVAICMDIVRNKCNIEEQLARKRNSFFVTAVHSIKVTGQQMTSSVVSHDRSLSITISAVVFIGMCWSYLLTEVP